MVNASYWIFGLFLLVNLGVGLWAGRNVKTFSSYAIADGRLGTGVLVMTLLATFVDAGDLCFPAYILRNAPPYILEIGLFVLQFILFGTYVAPRLAYFRGAITLGDVMRSLYNDRIGMFSGLVSLLFSIFGTAVQLQTLGELGSAMSGFSPATFVALGGGIIVVYTAFGGMRSVAITDVLQVIALGLVFIALTLAVIKYAGGIGPLVTAYPPQNLTTKRLTILTKFFYALFPVLILTPPIMQRMLMGYEATHLRKTYYILACIYAVLGACLILLGLGAYSVFQAGSNSYNEFGVLNGLVTILFATQPILQALCWVGLLAVMMSTIDSYLHAAGVSLAHDVVRPLWKDKKGTFNALAWARIATLAIGTMAIAMTLWRIQEKPSTFYLYTASFMSIITFPLLAGIMGLKPNTTAFYASCITYVISYASSYALFMLWFYTAPSMFTATLVRYGPWILSVVFSTAIFLFTHYLEYNTFVILPYPHIRRAT